MKLARRTLPIGKPPQHVGGRVGSGKGVEQLSDDLGSRTPHVLRAELHDFGYAIEHAELLQLRIEREYRWSQPHSHLQ